MSLADAEAIARAPHVLHAVPIVVGSGSVEANGRERSVSVYAVGPEFDRAFKFNVAGGTFLPPDELERARPVAVLGSKVYEELYGGANALGSRIRVGGDRYQVVGIMETKGDMVGVNLDDTVYIPAARGLELFNREGLAEIDVLYAENAPIDEVVEGIKRILLARHSGEDFTIVTQQQMLDVLGSIIGVLTLGVAALGGISLLVGGVGIFTIMTIAVRERTQEIGLLRAIGARRSRIAQLFVGEAMLLVRDRRRRRARARDRHRRAHAHRDAVDAGKDLAAVRRARARDRGDDRARGGRAAGARSRAARAARRVAARNRRASSLLRTSGVDCWTAGPGAADTFAPARTAHDRHLPGTPRRHPWGSAAHIPVRRRPGRRLS